MTNRLLATLALVLLAGAIDAQLPEFRGRIVDQDGKPARGVELADCWVFPDPGGERKDEPPTPYPENSPPLVTDENGEFLAAPGQEQFLFALDAERKLGALVTRHSAQATLQPLVEVRGRFEIRSVGEPPTRSALWVGPTANMAHFACCISTSRELRVWLPAGEYRLWTSTDAVSLYKSAELDRLSIEPGETVVDLGTIPLEIPLVVHPQGVVLDPRGDPLPNARVGVSWTSHEGTVFPFEGATTDEQGHFRFSIAIHDVERVQPLLALDPGETLGAVTTWFPKSLASGLTLRLSPTSRVHARFVVSGTSAPPEWMNTYVSLLPEGLRFLGRVSTTGELDLRLPAGSYRLESYGKDVGKVSRELVLPAEPGDVDLGTIELPLDVIARLRGQEAPAWTLTDARGIEKSTMLSDLRGKWVLLEFWGYW